MFKENVGNVAMLSFQDAMFTFFLYLTRIRTREPVCSRVDRYILHYTDLVVVPVVGPQLQDAVLQAGQLY